MKTIKFIITLLASTMLFSCEQPTTPTELKNNGPTLESRLCGIWNSVSKTPLGVAPEYSYPHECFDYKLIIDSNMVYTIYDKGKLSTQMKFFLNDTIYDKADNKYYGEIILEDSLEIYFSIISDNLYLTPVGKGENLLCGGCSYHYIKESN
jgi:hypothetical protein